jgi:hypothetical protein
MLKNKTGYLANITSADENAFLTSKLAGALNVWIGGTDGNCSGEDSKSLLPGINLQISANISSLCTSSPGSIGGTEGVFHWYDGPEAGEVFWRSSIPYYAEGRIIRFDSKHATNQQYFWEQSIQYIYFNGADNQPKRLDTWGYEPIFQNVANSVRKPLFSELPTAATLGDFNYGFQINLQLKRLYQNSLIFLVIDSNFQ